MPLKVHINVRFNDRQYYIFLNPFVYDLVRNSAFIFIVH
jgi:hypothetical protein